MFKKKDEFNPGKALVQAFKDHGNNVREESADLIRAKDAEIARLRDLINNSDGGADYVDLLRSDEAAGRRAMEVEDE